MNIKPVTWAKLPYFLYPLLAKSDLVIGYAVMKSRQYPYNHNWSYFAWNLIDHTCGEIWDFSDVDLSRVKQVIL